MSVEDLLSAYEQAHPKRAAGGIYAMAGFAYQAEVAISKSVTCLATKADFAQSGNVFIEALSDIAHQAADGSLVLLQVKRTLTTAALDSAAAEIAAIEAVDAAQVKPVRPCYGVVCQQHAIELDWVKLPKASPHAALMQSLLQNKRLQPPLHQPNPRWQTLSMLWSCHSDPFGFLRYALDRIMQRQANPADAAAYWEAIAERFQQGRVERPKFGQSLTCSDVVLPAHAANHLEVGKRVTWERWRKGQYMARPGLSQEAVSRALSLREQALQSPSSELVVFWLAGRSGAGKSVLLLNAVSDLVQRGHSVLWLKPEEVESALTQIVQGNALDMPDFLAVDDIYDPDARDQLDIGRISMVVDNQGSRAWPVLLTCGPSEFADDFEE